VRSIVFCLALVAHSDPQAQILNSPGVENLINRPHSSCSQAQEKEHIINTYITRFKQVEVPQQDFKFFEFFVPHSSCRKSAKDKETLKKKSKT
jgi:hypothetical protein